MNRGRRTKNREERREALRDELKAKEYLRQLQEIDETLAENWMTVSSEQVAALRLRADLNFRRLAKVLPDLKAVEISGSMDHHHSEIRPKEEILAEIRAKFPELAVTH